MRPLPPADPRALVPTRLSDHERRIARIERDTFGLPRCRATRTANLAVVTGTDTLVTLPTEDPDTNAFHDTTTNTSRLTIPSGLDGTYTVTGNVIWASNATGVRVSVFLKNGTSTGEGVSIAGLSGVETRQSFTEMMELAAGDYIEIRARQSSGGNLNITRASLQFVKLG